MCNFLFYRHLFNAVVQFWHVFSIFLLFIQETFHQTFISLYCQIKCGMNNKKKMNKKTVINFNVNWSAGEFNAKRALLSWRCCPGAISKSRNYHSFHRTNSFQLNLHSSALVVNQLWKLYRNHMEMKLNEMKIVAESQESKCSWFRLFLCLPDIWLLPSALIHRKSFEFSLTRNGRYMNSTQWWHNVRTRTPTNVSCCCCCWCCFKPWINSRWMRHQPLHWTLINPR